MVVQHAVPEVDDGGCRYKNPPDEEIIAYYGKIQEWLESYLKLHGIAIESVHADLRLIGNAIVRVLKRKDYYMVFHNGVKLSEVKEASLLAYWIVKYRPFTITSDVSDRNPLNINEGFATFIILSSLPNVKNTLSGEYIKSFVYGLQYWDLSKEAMMLIAETLHEANKK